MKLKLSQIQPALRRLKAALRRVWEWYLRWRYRTVKTAGLAVFVITLGLLIGNTIFSSAITVSLTPNSDVTAGWPSTGGTSDSSCAGGTHCDFIDETTPNSTDYISTSGSTAGGEVDEYGLSSPSDVATATQVSFRVYAQSATNANGGTLDNLSMNLRVNGTLQTAATCTPSYNIWADCNATYNGSWNQAAVDSMQVQLTRVRLGSGSASTQSDNVQVSTVRVSLIYSSSKTLNQSSYRWFNNADSSSQTSFINAWGGTTSDNANSHVNTTDGGFITTGTVNSFGAGGSDMFIAKYSSAGTLSWSKTWGGTGTDYGSAVIQTSDGGYAVTGYTANFGAGSSDMFIAKYTFGGGLEWSRTWGGTGVDWGYDLTQTSDGGYAVTGSTSSFGTGGDMFIAKYTSTGTLSWSKAWGGANSETGRSIAQMADGGYIIAGQTTSFGAGSTDTFIAKYTSTGTLSWSKTWGGTGIDYGYGLTLTGDGGFTVTGQTGSFGAGSNDAFIAKYTSTGTLSWSKTWGGTGSDIPYAVIQTSDGGYAITGQTASYGAGAGDMFIAKFTSTGTLSWSRVWGGTSLDVGYGISQATDGGYVVSGQTTSFGAGGNDSLVAKYDASGNISGCGSACKADGTDYTSTVKSDGTDYNSTVKSDGTDYTSTSSSDGTDYTSTNKTDGTDYTSTRQADGVNFTSTSTVLVSIGPSIDVGSALAAQDTVATAPADGTAFRLRLNLHVTGAQINAGDYAYKLQYAAKGGAASCSVATGYGDVSDTSTIRYADNPIGGNGQPLATNANDPTHSTDTLVRQTYQETGATTFTSTTAIAVGQDGMWDFALTGYHTIQNTTYCFRVIKSDNSVLNSYTVYPEITTPPATFTQGSYRWFDGVQTTDSFANVLGSTVAESIYDVTQTNDGGYAIVGATAGFGAVSGDMFIAKYTSTGTLSWSKTWGGAGSDTGNAIVQTSDGGFAVTGSTLSFGAGGNDMFIAKYTSTGTLSWSKTWGGAATTESGSDIVQTSDGGYAVAGGGGFGAGGNDMFIAKYTSTGTLSWSKTWGGTGSDTATSLVQTSDGGYAVTGSSASFGAGGNDMFIAKYTSTGTLSWSKTWGGTANDVGNSIVQTSDGGYAVTGNTNNYGVTQLAFIAKYTSTGSLSWSHTVSLGTSNFGRSIVQTTDGGYAVAGESVIAGGTYSYIAKYAANGTLSWTGAFGDGDNYRAYAIDQTSDGGYIVAGTSNATMFSAGNYDALLIKYRSDGTINGCGYLCPAEGLDYSVAVQTDGTDYTSTVKSDGTDYTSTVKSDGTDYTSTVKSDGTDYTSTLTTVVSYSGAASTHAALAPTNVPYDMLTLQPVYLGVMVRTETSGVNTSGAALKLQFAVRGAAATCSAVSSGSFSDVTGSSLLRYYDNTSFTDATNLLVGSNDPDDSGRTIRYQTYEETNNFTNGQSIVYAGESGYWLFSLAIDSASIKNKDICVRVATSGGSLLSASNIGQVSYGPLMENLMHGGNSFSRAGIKQNISL